MVYGIEVRFADADSGRRRVMLTGEGITVSEGTWYDLTATMFHTPEQAKEACEYVRQSPEGRKLTAGTDDVLRTLPLPISAPDLHKRYVVKVEAANWQAYFRFDGKGARAERLAQATRFAGKLGARQAAEHAQGRMLGTRGRPYETAVVEELAEEQQLTDQAAAVV